MDNKSAYLLSDFFLDISKAFFIATFVTTPISGISNPLEIVFLFTKEILNAFLFIIISRYMLEFT